MAKKSIKSERLKAVREAWKKEQKLVQEGKGTREWTPEQQRQILEIGKALDDDGEAFEGHHMKNVKNHPDYAGDPENIQFLTKVEHKEAHKGSFNNSTNWYYNPETREYKEVGSSILEPCEVIKLKEPVAKINSVLNGEGCLSEEGENSTLIKNEGHNKRGNNDTKRQPEKRIHYVDRKETNLTTSHNNKREVGNRSEITQHSSGLASTNEKPTGCSVFRKILNGVGGVVNTIVDFTEEHPFITNIGSTIFNIMLSKAMDKQYGDYSSNNDLDMDFSETETPTRSDIRSEEEYPASIDTGNGYGSPKAPHYRSGFTRKIKTGIDDDGNTTYKEVSVRPTYVHKDQFDDNDDD